MAYLDCGQGAPLVLVHGSLSDYRTWILQMAPFSAQYRTIAVSLRHCYPECWKGHGDDFSLRQHADDLAMFVKALNVGPVHLVAHSRGGDVALIMAAEHPQLLQSIVLADPAPLDTMLPDTPEVSSATAARKAVVTEALEKLQAGDLDGGLEVFTDAANAPGAWEKLPKSARRIRRDNAWSLKSLVADSQVPFKGADAKRISAPVLLVTGDRSPCLYGMMHAALQGCLRCPQKVLIANASHGMHRENPEAFSAAVLGFLGEMPDPTRPPDGIIGTGKKSGGMICAQRPKGVDGDGDDGSA